MMKIGMTTFGFRHLVAGRAQAPSLIQIVQRARRLGFDSLQICENVNPMELSDRDWQAVLQCAYDAGLDIELGCKAVELDDFWPWAERASLLPNRILRLVLEGDGTAQISRHQIDAFLAGAMPFLETHHLRLAIENHYDVSSHILANSVSPYPTHLVGFCVDTANSLCNFESTEMVLDLLSDRAFCYHLKDFKVEKCRLAFRVTGAPLGEGTLDLNRVLERILARKPTPQIFVEHWRTAVGEWEADVCEDDAWLRQSLATLQDRLSTMESTSLARGSSD